MSEARNLKGAPTGRGRRDAQKKTPTKESNESVSSDSATRKDHTAASVYWLGELRERIREADDEPRLRCPYCGTPDPGFVDSSAPDQAATCDCCGTESTVGRWRETADLSDAVISLKSPTRGYYGITWHDGQARITHRDDIDSPSHVVAVVWPVDERAVVSRYDVAPHYRLLGLLDEHGITIREEG
ncbi:MAG: hypothetical protein ABEN55_09885 [Bradymonadaceae bacterium]